MNDLAPPTSNARVWTPVVILTVIAAFERSAGFGRLGLDHFDEGIYALAGLWSLSGHGLAGLDPGVIPYAPPAFPLLVGISFELFGPSDLAAIAVSIVAGIAAIPATYWIGRKTFGPAFGIAAAGFAAASMPHIAFSRMALTDASFLLAWLLAMTAGGRFLERPGPGRAIALGLAVGVSQLIKYNGWLAGAIVAATACLGPMVSAEERSRARLARAFGWGLFAALVTACVYWPWFRFVDRHGGYISLLKHQRGYVDGLSAWPANWILQLRQLVAFAPTGWAEAALGPTFAAIGLILLERRPPRGPVAGMIVLGIVLLMLTRASSTWWLGLGLLAFLLRHESSRVRLLGVWWLALSMLVPIYHPYARLWLPLEAAGWLIGGMAIGTVFGWCDGQMAGPNRQTLAGHRAILLPAAVGLLVAWAVPSLIPPRPRPLPGGLAEPRDSLRAATLRLLAAVPGSVRAVRLLGRPPVLFYAAPALARQGIAAGRVASSEDLLASVDDSWAIVDSASLRQEGAPEQRRARLLERWEVVSELPTTLSKATLLDVDPAAAVGDLSAKDEPLLLIRPRRGAVR